MEQQDPGDRETGRRPIARQQCRFQPGERGGGAGNAGIAGARVLLERQAAREAAGEAPGGLTA